MALLIAKRAAPVEPVVAPTISLGVVTSSSIQVLISGGANIAALTPRRNGTELTPISTSASSYTFTGLSPETEYELDVKADGEDGPQYSNYLIEVTEANSNSLGFEPAHVLTFQGMTTGANAVGANAMADVTSNNGGSVSSAISGPFGSNRIMRSRLNPGAGAERFFGGTAYHHGANITAGMDLWIRFPAYFDMNWFFRFAEVSGGSGTLPDGWGGLKFFRLQWRDDDNETGPRMTFQLGGFEHLTAKTTGTMWGATIEYGGDTRNMELPDGGPNVLSKGSWQFAQYRVHFQTNSSGFIDGWIGSTHIGRTMGATLPTPTGDRYLRSIHLGDYYNGGVTAQQDFYVDNVIFTFNTPADVDGGGRPFIAPSRNAEA